MTPSSRESGAVSIIVVAMLVVALVLVLGAARLGAVMVAKARAETAADAAALAAADTLALGHRAPERAARDTALHNAARLVSCDCRGAHAEVLVEVRVRGITGGRVRARARAEVRAHCVVGCAPDAALSRMPLPRATAAGAT